MEVYPYRYLIQIYITLNGIHSYMSHNVSIRLDDEILKELKELNLNVSETVRRALREEIKRRRKEELKKNMDLARKLLSSEDVEFYVKAVRETRDER